MGTLKKIAVGSGIAAVAGYVAGVLTAPKSGKQTRKDIKVAAEKNRLEAENELKRLHSELNRIIKEADKKKGTLSAKAKTELKARLDKANDNKEKAREVLSAIHDGDAADHDLKRAVKDAKSSLEHLKDYLKK
jgi:gas vesicle protein